MSIKYEVVFDVVQYGTCAVQVEAENEEEAETLAYEKYGDEVELSDIWFHDSTQDVQSVAQLPSDGNPLPNFEDVMEMTT